MQPETLQPGWNICSTTTRGELPFSFCSVTHGHDRRSLSGAGFPVPSAILESLRLEKTSKSTWSNHSLSPMSPIRPCSTASAASNLQAPLLNLAGPFRDELLWILLAERTTNWMRRHPQRLGFSPLALETSPIHALLLKPR